MVSKKDGDLLGPVRYCVELVQASSGEGALESTQEWLEGDPTLSFRAGETGESWRIAEPILEVWGEGRMLLLGYPAGSDGPREAAEVRARHVRRGI